MALKILVVDDASFIRDLIKKTLRKFLPKADVQEAAHGKKAQTLLKNQPFDLILSDWEMPEMSGEELLLWVRGQEHLSDTPFIMISSRGEKDHVIKALQAGVSDYLGKPFTNEELMQKVQKALVKAGKASPDSIKPKASSSGPFSSLEVFSTDKPAESKKPVPNPGGSANALLGAMPGNNAVAKANQAKEKPKMKGLAQLRFAGYEVKCMIKDIGLQEMTALIKRSDNNPAVLQQAVVDILPTGSDASEIARINAYVHSIAAVEKRIDVEFLKIVVCFVDEDAKKMQQLSKFIQSM